MLLTTERIILLEQHGLLHKEFAECNLESVQQVTHEIKGLLPTLLKYGTFSIYTAGSQHTFVIKNLPDPYAVQQEVLRVITE